MNKNNRQLYPEHYNLLYRLLDALDETRQEDPVMVFETEKGYRVCGLTPKGLTPKPRNRQVQD